MDIKMRFKNAIEPMMPCSEEPARGDYTDRSYSVFRKVSERSLYSSGIKIDTTLIYELEARLVSNEDADFCSKELRTRLERAGFEKVREYGREWDSETSRRILRMSVSVKQL